MADDSVRPSRELRKSELAAESPEDRRRREKAYAKVLNEFQCHCGQRHSTQDDLDLHRRAAHGGM